MSLTFGDIVGLAGSALFIAAFAYANAAKQLNKVAFNLANLVGAVLLLISLSISFNLASFVLEVVWGVIAAVGLISALLKSPSRARGAEGVPEEQRPGVGQLDARLTGPPPAPPAGGRGEP